VAHLRPYPSGARVCASTREIRREALRAFVLCAEAALPLTVMPPLLVVRERVTRDRAARRSGVGSPTTSSTLR